MRLFQRVSLEHPILVGLGLVAAALAFRLVDIFVLRLDERLGEIILSKAAGLGLVALFLWLTGRQWGDIGLHARSVAASMLLGIGLTVIALAAGYLVEMGLSARQNAHPTLLLAAVDPKSQAAGGVMFALWLLAGNVVNSFMEEGLFRGVLMKLFSRAMSVAKANWLQALLFAAWHLPWAWKGYQTGELQTQGEIAFGTAANFVPMLVMGLIWGYLYVKTNNLWSCWIAHMLTNSAVNYLHVGTDQGLDHGLAARMVTFMVVMALGSLLVNPVARRLRILPFMPWGK